MARWTIDRPAAHTLDGIVALRVRIVGGHVNILPTDDLLSFEVAAVEGEPILASHEAGILTITYEDLTRGGFLDRLRETRLGGYRRLNQRSATLYVRVPRDCPVEVTTVSAGVVAAGLTARTTLRSASGDITLDDMSGTVDVNTASGDLDLRDIAGSLNYTSVSGELAVAGGRVADFTAKSGSGQLLADVDVDPAARVRLASVSGDVALRIPAETSARVEVRTATGKISSDFTLEDQNRPGFSQVGGSIGNGIDPATVSTTTVSGAVTLLRRAPDAPAAIPRGE
jgi:hypothetical protein